MSGLSNATFMGGLMQGANFVEGMQNRSHARGLADEAFSMKKETHDQQTKLNGFKIEEAETKLLLSDLDRDLRSMEETGETFSQEQWKKYKALGFDKFNNQDWREENKDAGALLHRGMTTGEWGEGALDAFNTTFYDELRGREKEDGLKRKIIGVKETEDGRSVAILEITGKDGKKYNAPLTKGGTADDEDSLVLFDDEKLDEIYKVQMHRADMAYAIDKAGGDPKKLASVLRRIAFKSDKSEYTIKDVRDESGQSRMARFDKNKNFVNWVGGAEPFKDSKGRLVGRDRGVGLSGIDLEKSLKEYRDKRQTALNSDNPEAALEAVDNDFLDTTGLNPRAYALVKERKIQLGDSSSISADELQRATYFLQQGAINKDVSGAIENNPEIFGTGQPSEQQLARQEANSAFWQQEGVESFSGVQANGAGSSPPPTNQQGLSNQQGNQSQSQQDPIQRLSEVSNTLRTYSPVSGNIPREKANQLMAERSQLEVQAEALKQEFIKPIQGEIENLIGQQQKKIPGGLADVTDFKTAMRASQAIKNHSTPESKKIQRLKQAVYAINNAESQAEIQKIFADVTVSNIDKNQDNSATL